MKDIMSYTEWDKDFLKEQIELIKPTVIVCGGTYEMLRHIILNLEKWNVAAMEQPCWGI